MKSRFFMLNLPRAQGAAVWGARRSLQGSFAICCLFPTQRAGRAAHCA
ncbi:hypothetical protein A2U01_0086451, partial [Trifolium medium]|nr:hypothetical protein [Trifolium medium]